MLRISAGLNGGHVSVIVEDNGPGLASDGSSPTGTGKGLKIVSELTDLFYRLEKVRITWSIEDLNGSNPAETGTRAIIRMPLRGS